MALDPTALNPEQTPAELSPGFFDGAGDDVLIGSTGVDTVSDAPDGATIPPEGTEVALGLGNIIKAVGEAAKKVKGAEKKGETFRRTGRPEDEPVPDLKGGEEPTGVAPDADQMPGPETSASDAEEYFRKQDGRPPQEVPKGRVEIQVSGPKITEVMEEYKRFTTDTPFSALDDFNAANLDTDQDVMAVIAAHSKVYAKEMTDATGGVIQHKVSRHMADLIGASKGRLMQKLLGGEILHGKQPGEIAANMLAARDLLVWSAQKVDELAKLVHTGNADDLIKVGFDTVEEAAVAMNRQAALHVAIQAKVKGAKTEIARTQSAQRIAARGDPLRDQNIAAMLEGGGGLAFAKKKAAMLLSYEDPVQRANFLRRSKTAKTFDALYEAWVNGLLSNPVTHMVNLLGNFFHMTGQIVVRGTAAAFARARRARTGENNGVQSGEGTAMTFAIWMAMRDASKMAGKVFKDPSGEIMAKVEPGVKLRQNSFSAEGFEASGIAGKAFDLGGTLLTMGRVGTRGLAAGDVFFKVLSQRMEIYARAYRETALEFGDTAASRMDEFSEALADRMANPTAATQEAAFDFGRYVTFTGQLGSFGSAAQTIAANGFIRWFVPFLRTPANIIKTSWEYTPMHMATERYRTAIAQGGEAADLAKARVALGTATMVSVAGLARAGFITGGGPSDAVLRENLTRQGWQPYSIKIGDRYYSYKRIEPFATVIGIAADLTAIAGQVYDTGKYDKIVTSLAVALAKNVTSKTYMEGFSKLIDVIQNPERYGQAAIENFMRTIMPRIGANIERQFDPELRYTRGLLDALIQDVPGFSSILQPDVDLWGRHVVYETGPYGTGMINPFYTSTEKPNPVDAEMDRLQFGMDVPGEVIPTVQTDVKLQAKELYDYRVKAGQFSLARAKAELLTEEYRTSKSDEHKKILLHQAIMDGRKDAQDWLLDEGWRKRRRRHQRYLFKYSSEIMGKPSEHADTITKMINMILDDREQRLEQ